MRYIMVLFILSNVLFSQDISNEWLTKAERTNFKETSRYEETIDYCLRLSKGSPFVHFTTFGKSGEDRDLPLLIVSKDKFFDPKKARLSSKAIIMIQNGIHAGEIEGKDASLMLLRDIVITKKYIHLLDSVILLVIPIYNVDGHERFGKYNRINQNGPEEMGWRTNATNLNLNRDYMKAEAPETKAFLKLFTAWLPDFFIDVHTTNGADYQYALTYSIESQENVALPVRKWINEKFLPDVLENLNRKGYPAAPYIWLKDNKDPAKGMYGGTAPPRLSNTYVPLHNRPALLIETHMLKDYRTRVNAVYEFLLTVIENINSNPSSLKHSVKLADNFTINSLENPFPIRFETTNEPDTILFLGYKTVVEKSDISGTEWVKWTDEPLNLNIPWFNKIKPTISITPPVAYIIPRQWKSVVEILKYHGVVVEKLKQPIEVQIEYFKFTNPKWQEKPYEGRHPVSFSTEKYNATNKYPSGTYIVRLNQRTNRVIINLLEPEAPDALISWGYFDTIFEQKEYAEDYVLEKLARDMLANDENLRKEFYDKLLTDSSFASNPRVRLNFFYQRSPYWDNQLNIYPIVRTMDTITTQTEIVK
ncbi:MAG: hypothetical protein IGBAC_1042 [Ignavibacteriae bacterium]|nr:MAG: hypothetical protein IGBAC_1042 [Ignavibacteriota bacterium]